MLCSLVPRHYWWHQGQEVVVQCPVLSQWPSPVAERPLPHSLPTLESPRLSPHPLEGEAFWPGSRGRKGSERVMEREGRIYRESWEREIDVYIVKEFFTSSNTRNISSD